MIFIVLVLCLPAYFVGAKTSKLPINTFFIRPRQARNLQVFFLNVAVFAGLKGPSHAWIASSAGRKAGSTGRPGRGEVELAETSAQGTCTETLVVVRAVPQSVLSKLQESLLRRNMVFRAEIDFGYTRKINTWKEIFLELTL